MYTEGAVSSAKLGLLVFSGASAARFFEMVAVQQMPAGFEQVSYFGLVVMVVWFLLHKLDKTLSSNTAALRSVQAAVNYQSMILIQHDATVRGTNPDTIGTTEEILARIQAATKVHE